MATYVVIHGAGDVASNWDLAAAELRERGHDVVAVDLPCEDDSAGWSEYADTVIEAIGDRGDLVVVAHSLGGFTAPVVCDRVPVDLLVLVAGMIPSPGESGDEWWEASGCAQATRPAAEGPIATFLQDVAPDLAEAALSNERAQSSTPGRQQWPLDAWPDVPTRYLLCRDDRFLPADFARRHARERLGIAADEIAGGHCPYLSRPRELAERLEAYRTAVVDSDSVASPGRP